MSLIDGIDFFSDDEKERAFEANARAEWNNPKAYDLYKDLLTNSTLETMPEPTYVIDGLLMANTTSLMWGKPGTGKSFIALDWALSIATGASWLGREVIAGDVLYIAAEGANGLGIRKRAWQAEHGVTSEDITDSLGWCRWLPRRVNLLDSSQVDGLVEVARELTPVLIVVDTLNKCMPGGDENSPKDMSLVLDAADQLRQATGAAVLLIHHPGRDGLNPRGHSSIDGNVDTMIECKRSRGSGRVRLTVDKQKDGTEEVVTVNLVPFEDSCVIRSGEDAASSPNTSGSNEPLTEHEERVLRSIQEHSGSKGVAATVLMNRTGLTNGAFYKALRGLVNRGVVEKTSMSKRAPYVLSKAVQVA